MSNETGLPTTKEISEIWRNAPRPWWSESHLERESLHRNLLKSAIKNEET